MHKYIYTHTYPLIFPGKLASSSLFFFSSYWLLLIAMLLHLPSQLAVSCVLTDFENRWASDTEKQGLFCSVLVAWREPVPCPWRCGIVRCVAMPSLPGHARKRRDREDMVRDDHSDWWQIILGCSSKPCGCVFHVALKSWKETTRCLGVKMKTLSFPLSLHSSIYRFGGLQCFGYSAERPLAATLRLNPKAKAL